MASVQQDLARSTLIRAIDRSAFMHLADRLHRVQLDGGALLMTAEAPIEAVYFPETLVTSYIDVMADGTRVEIGIAGHEGMAGWPVLLGSDVSPHDVVVHMGGGSALRIDADALVEICARHPAVAAVFLRYVTAFTVQVARTAVSNLRDPVERRLSRWLLMFHDRLDGDEIDLTHKAIASMLGIRRASVTDGLHALEGHDLIRNRRGRIVIRDRSRLRKLAGDGYGHAEAHYSRTIAPFGKCASEPVLPRRDREYQPLRVIC